MKDGYSFDLTGEAAREAYNKSFVAYLRTFARMGLKAIPTRADAGPIGGDMSHEFLILADTGEFELFCHKAFLEMGLDDLDVDYEDAVAVAAVVDRFTSRYSATDEKHDPVREAELGGDLVVRRGIEVGHIFPISAPSTGKTGRQGHERGRSGGRGRNGILWYRYFAFGRRHYRGESRRGGHRLAEPVAPSRWA